MTPAAAAALALRWASRGVPAGPIGISWNKRKGQTDKRPLTSHGFRDWTADTETVRRQFNGATLRRGEEVGVGLWLGPAGYMVLDVDVKAGARGDEELAALEERHGQLPTTPTATTASGGLHVWLVKDGAMGNTTLAPGVDVRADNGYVVAPGVVTPWGSWTFEAPGGDVLAGADPAPAPSWVLERLAARAANGSELNKPTPAEAEPLPDHLPAAVARALEGEELPAKDRTRSGQLFALVRACKRAGLSQGQALTAASRHAPSWEHVGRNERQLRRQVAKCWAAFGDDDRGREVPNEPEEDDAPPVGLCPDGYRLTDAGNAGRLIAGADGRLRFVHAWGKWLVYRGGRWVIDHHDTLVTEQAKRVTRRLLREVVPHLEGEERKAAFGWAVRSESSSGIAAMVRLARGIPGVLVEHDELDSDPWLLNVRNGTIDLGTGELRPPDPADLCTMQAPVAYDPEVRSELWESCLATWQPDPENRDYLQREAGAGATGVPTEVLSIHYGPGGNGKSRFFGALAATLGPYAHSVHRSLLLARTGDQHDTVRADLFRCRLAIAAETENTARLAEAQVKELTGGDQLSARRMREDLWHFWPTHSIVLFSNHQPRVIGRDHGVWRRLRLVPWVVTIPAGQEDTQLASKLAAERPAILAWIVAGARKFHERGLSPPETVRAATDRYRHDQNHAARFVEECLEVGQGDVTTADISAAIEAWSTDHGLKYPPTMNEVGPLLAAAGCASSRQNVADPEHEGKRLKVTVWSPVRLAPEWRPPEPRGDQGALELPSPPQDDDQDF